MNYRIPTLLLTLLLVGNVHSQTNKYLMKLPLCPNTPNCVSSQTQDSAHAIAPFKLKVNAQTAWKGFQEALSNEPRTEIIIVMENRLQAEAKSRVFRFVDVIDAILDYKEKVIHIRSASRTGYGDFGVNRARVERLRKTLQNAELIE